MKKKILFFLPGGTGGAERVSVTIAKFLPIEEWEVKFVIVDRKRGTIEKFIPNGIDVKFIKIRNIWDFVSFRIYALIKKEKPDFVFVSIFHLSPRVLVAAKLCGVKAIVRSSNMLKDGLPYYKKLMLKYTYPWAYKVIAQQEEMRVELLNEFSLDPQRVLALQNPLDINSINAKIRVPSPFRDVNQDRFVWVARIAYQKGQDILIKAFDIVRRKNPRAHLYLIGAYSEEDQFYQNIQQYIKDSKIEGFVHFMGFDENPYRWMYNCDCFVLPSRWEGLPNALIEATYLGKPAVSTKCLPIITRIINEGINGYTCERENPQDMANAMEKALKMTVVKQPYYSASPEDFVNLFE